VIFVLLGGGYGGYRLATSLIARQTQPRNNTAPPVTTSQPKVEVSKRAPIVSGEFSGAELYLPDAEYPSAATTSEGTVTVEVRVSKKGIVVGARAVDGDESLKPAAEKAARSSAFSPKKLEDKPALMTGTITYHFNSSFKTPVSNEANPDSETTATLGGPLVGTELNLVQPRKPASFKGTDSEDKVTLVVRVNRSGRVVSWRLLVGAQELRTVSVNAAKQSTFSPDKLPDTGDVVGTITYNFH
jgi:TonB family protein